MIEYEDHLFVEDKSSLLAVAAQIYTETCNDCYYHGTLTSFQDVAVILYRFKYSLGIW